MALLGLSFDDITDPIVEAVGEGAYEIGGGDWQFGQDRTEADVKNLFRPPVPLPDLSDALALFQEYLHWIPLDALRQFRNLLPGVTDADFSDVPTAVSTIIASLTDKPLNQILLDFLRNAITGIDDATDALVAQFFGNLRDFVGLDFTDVEFEINEARQTFVTNVIEPFLAALESIDQALRDALTGITGATGIDVNAWVQGVLDIDSPLDALNLFNIVPPTLLGQIDISHIGTNVTNLITDPTFLDPRLITDWIHNPTGGFGGTGSRSTTANGTTKELLSNLIPVSAGQSLPISARAKWSGLLGTGNPIQLALTGYNAEDEAVDQKILASHNTTPPTTDWIPLSGTYDVQDGSEVTGVRTRLVVSSAATAGTVSFSTISTTKIGTLLQRLISGTDPGTTLDDDITNLFTGITHNAVALLDKVGLDEFGNLVEGIGGSVGGGITQAIDRINTFLDDSSPLNGSNILSGAVGDQWVPGIGNLHDGIITAVGNLTGGAVDLPKVKEVLSGQTESVLSHGAGIIEALSRLGVIESRVAALPIASGGDGAGTADGGVIGVTDTDTFERVSNTSLGSLWLPYYSGGSSSAVWATPNGHDASFIEAGTGDRDFLMIRNNSAIPRSQTNFQRVTLELNGKSQRYYDSILGTYNFTGHIDAWLRVSDATTSLANVTGYRVRWGGDGSISIVQFLNGAAATLIAKGEWYVTPPGAGALLIGEAGVLDDNAPQMIRLRIGSNVWIQATGTLAVGPTSRRWGHGGRAEGHLIPPGLESPAGLHYWNGTDQHKK